MKIFIDSDVILDVIQKRQNFEYSSKILEYIEKGEITGFTSPVVLTNIFYIISKEENKYKALTAIKSLRKILKISMVDESVVDKAVNSDFKDFEDAIQYFSAIKAQCDYLITRNANDYLDQEIKVISPKELIAILELN